MSAANWGLLAFLGFSIAGMGSAILIWGDSRPSLSNAPPYDDAEAILPPVHEEEPSPHAMHRSSAAKADDTRLDQSFEHLLELLGQTGAADEDELDRTEQALLALGERAAEPVVTLLRREPDSARRELLLNFLRKIPGSMAEAYLIAEARAGNKRSSRMLAIDALAERRTDVALDALDQIAKTDPDVPSRPFVARPRQPDDDSTELPDEVSFTPRMKAMAALASTQEARAALMLSDILRDEPDDALRMEAARNLGQLRGDPTVIDSLLACLGSDRSAYVRLAALHSLEGVVDPRLLGALTQLAEHDADRGVQALARRLLARLTSAG